MIGIDFHHGNVTAFVAADNLPDQFTPVTEPDDYLVRVLDDVGIGHNVAVSGDNETRTQ